MKTATSESWKNKSRYTRRESPRDPISWENAKNEIRVERNSSYKYNTISITKKVNHVTTLKMHLQFSSGSNGNNKKTHRHRLNFLRKVPKGNNHRGTNGKPHPLWRYKCFGGIKRPSKYGWTSMEQLNGQHTWLHVPEMGKTYMDQQNWVHFLQKHT